MCFLSFPALLLACGGPPEPAEPVVRAPTQITSRRSEHAGQVQGLVAPGADLVARVPIQAVEGRDFATWWQPEILGADGAVIYRDAQGFPARFNVYWAWDAQQQLWLYNTDDGTVWIYASAEQDWERRRWERSSGQEPPAEIRARLDRAP